MAVLEHQLSGDDSAVALLALAASVAAQGDGTALRALKDNAATVACGRDTALEAQAVAWVRQWLRGAFARAQLLAVLEAIARATGRDAHPLPADSCVDAAVDHLSASLRCVPLPAAFSHVEGATLPPGAHVVVNTALRDEGPDAAVALAVVALHELAHVARMLSLPGVEITPPLARPSVAGRTAAPQPPCAEAHFDDAGAAFEDRLTGGRGRIVVNAAMVRRLRDWTGEGCLLEPSPTTHRVAFEPRVANRPPESKRRGSAARFAAAPAT